jgi:hypothetical protein
MDIFSLETIVLGFFVVGVFWHFLTNQRSGSFRLEQVGFAYITKLKGLGSIPASSDTVESEGRQMKQCRIQYIEKKIQKNPPVQKVLV